MDFQKFMDMDYHDRKLLMNKQNDEITKSIEEEKIKKKREQDIINKNKREKLIFDNNLIKLYSDYLDCSSYFIDPNTNLIMEFENITGNYHGVPVNVATHLINLPENKKFFKC